jgi:hypothetical protein
MIRVRNESRDLFLWTFNLFRETIPLHPRIIVGAGQREGREMCPLSYRTEFRDQITGV